MWRRSTFMLTASYVSLGPGGTKKRRMRIITVGVPSFDSWLRGMLLSLTILLLS